MVIGKKVEVQTAIQAASISELSFRRKTYGIISARNGYAIPGKRKYAGVAVHGACVMTGGNRILAPVGLTNGLWRDGSNSLQGEGVKHTDWPIGVLGGKRRHRRILTRR